jgi:hypothetical protein
MRGFEGGGNKGRGEQQDTLTLSLWERVRVRAVGEEVRWRYSAHC